MIWKRRRWLLVAVISSFASVSCSNGDGETETAASRGESIYRSACITCHAADPSQDGNIGPAIAGSSEQLLRLKLVKGTYPSGYTPKHASKLMPNFEYLEAYSGDLAAFLQESEGS